MSNPTPAPLFFIGVEFTKVAFTRALGKDEKPIDVSVIHKTTAPSELDYSFECRIGVEVISQAADNPFSLSVEAVGLFKLVGEFDDTRWRNYQNISAPSLVYPYVRAFISNLTVTAGLNAITIQPIDFARAYQLKLAEEAAKESSQQELPFDTSKEAE